MAGNAVLLKPSEVTPLSGQLVEQLLRAVGLPEGVFQLLLGDGETGAALVGAGSTRSPSPAASRPGAAWPRPAAAADPLHARARRQGPDDRVRGRRPRARRGRRRVRRVLERGSDLRLDRARLRRGRGGRRVHAQGAREDGGPAPGARRRVGRGRDHRGRPARRDRGARRRREAARRQGADRRAPQPGLARPLSRAHRAHRSQPRHADHARGDLRPGPPIMRVRDDDEALRLANDTRFGLNATVWTRDKRRGRSWRRRSSRAARGERLPGDLRHPQVALRRRGESGIGQVDGESGLRATATPSPS